MSFDSINMETHLKLRIFYHHTLIILSVTCSQHAWVSFNREHAKKEDAVMDFKYGFISFKKMDGEVEFCQEN